VTNQGGLFSQTTFHAVAVFNPATGAGFEQGAGSVPSAVGSFTANPSLGGTGTITNLIARYDAATGAPTTTSAFKFSYSAASLSFSSTTTTGVKWLAMNGNKSWMRAEGTVTVSGVSEPAYALVAVVDATAGADRVRVKIWSKTDGRIIYDNQKDASGASPFDEADATPATVSAGTITFFK
jgi:large repetitive protein